MLLTLKNNLGFTWYKNESVFIKGYFFDDDNNFLEKENAIAFLSEIKSKEEFFSLRSKLNGCYTIIINIASTYYITSDTTRSFPLFYTFKNDAIYFSDDISYLNKKLNLNTYNSLAELELKNSLHTYGDKTLLENVYQVQSDEYLVIQKNKIIDRGFSFSYATLTTNDSTYANLKAQAITAFENSFKRLLISLDNRTAVIPLSGGYDSRLIAVFLKKHNYKNVVCFTYGRKDSFEVENSKKTAEKLGFKWHFIEYTEAIYKNYNTKEQFRKYAHFAGKFSSMPYLQEYFAIDFLQQENLIPKNSVFIPGFAGDALGGSQFLKVIPENLKNNQIVDLIIKTKFSERTLTIKEKTLVKEEIKNILTSYRYTNELPYSIFEDFDFKEKIAKYIFNSANFYTFFGYEHRFPFWDKELLKFFKTVPKQHKIGKHFFDELLIKNYFKPYQVNFKKELQPSKNRLRIQKVKNKIRPFLSDNFKKKLLKKNDWHNYEPLTKILELEIENKKLELFKNHKSYNEIIIQWYVYYCKNKL